MGIRTVDHPDEILGLPWLVEAELIVDERVIVDAHAVVLVDDVP